MSHARFFRLVSKLNPFPGMSHLDVAGGTGELVILNYMFHLSNCLESTFEAWFEYLTSLYFLYTVSVAGSAFGIFMNLACLLSIMKPSFGLRMRLAE